MASKLKRERDGLSSPAPIMLIFDSKEPIYPIKLTATVASDLYLELFVIGNKTAANKYLTRELSKKFFLSETYSDRDLWYPKDGSWTLLGHPKLKDLLWPGCWITRLAGRLTPEQMRDDITIQWDGTKAYRKVYYSKDGRVLTAYTAGLGAWCISLVILVLYFRVLKKIRIGCDRWFVIVLMCSLIFSLVYAGVTFIRINPIHVREQSAFDRMIYRSYIEIFYATAISDSFLADNHDSPQYAEAQIKGFLRSVSLKNFYLNKPITIEDSPGNLSLETVNNQVRLLYYDIGTVPCEPCESCIEEDHCIEVEYDEIVNVEDFRDFIDTVPITYVDYEFLMVLADIYKKQPRQLVPIAVEYLNELWQQNNKDDKSYPLTHAKVYKVCRVLACIAHVELPAQITDKQTVDTFVTQVIDKVEEEANREPLNAQDKN